jgi:hypothetical protein
MLDKVLNPCITRHKVPFSLHCIARSSGLFAWPRFPPILAIFYNYSVKNILTHI